MTSLDDETPVEVTHKPQVNTSRYVLCTGTVVLRSHSRDYLEI